MGAHEEARTVGRQEVPVSATPLNKGIRNRKSYPLRPCVGQGASLGEEAVLGLRARGKKSGLSAHPVKGFRRSTRQIK